MGERTVAMKKQRNYVNMEVNPCKMCMPMGASLALKGFKKTMNIIHGSQGCSTYIRRHMAAHYNEPIDIASSSLSEEGTVYGGAKNLKIGIHNLVEMYQPEIVGVLTTCLAETIGEDIKNIVHEVRQTGSFENVDIIPISTPGYGGSEAEGYFVALRDILKYYTHKFMKIQNLEHSVLPKYEGDHINIIVSNATCEDVREIKRLVSMMKVEAFILPDISDALDAPYTPDYNKLSEEGVSRDHIYKAFTAKATIELGDLIHESYSPALYLNEVYGIDAYQMPLPIGIHHTDRLIETIASIYQIPIPKEVEKERGRLLDAMIDSHKHSAEGKIALFGDMHLVYAMAGLCLENGMKLKVAATGAVNTRFYERMMLLLGRYHQSSVILQDTDFETIHKEIVTEGVNLMMGHSDGKFIWEKEGIDFIRVGFPVHDHVGAQRKLYFGYKGSSRLLDDMVNLLLDQKHSGYRNRMLTAYYRGNQTKEVGVS
jgi:nitrogenase molybdenum-iron protein NifN